MNNKILNQQIELLSPDIIIYGGTYKYFIKNFSKEKLLNKFLLNRGNKRLTKGASYIIDGRLHIGTYHPSCRMKDKNYCNNILNAVKEWENQKL